ncbi:hypothetical protein GH733_001588 [Mirounga leonina]|nr:hypothetical protein GH733_001588 [Mirounga leonina]
MKIKGNWWMSIPRGNLQDHPEQQLQQGVVRDDPAEPALVMLTNFRGRETGGGVCAREYT